MKLIKVLSVLILLFAVFSNLEAQSKMTMAEYNAELQAWEMRARDAQKAIQETEATIEARKQEIRQTEEANLKVWDEIYQLVEASETEVAEFRGQIDSLKQEVDAFSELPVEEQKKNQLDLNRKISKMHKTKMGALTDVHEQLGELEKKMVIINLKLR